MKFTDRQIKALKPKKERYEVWETNGKGFGIRVSSTGRKSFIFLYKFQGTSRRITFGNYPEMSLADAHATHAKSRQLLERGADPATIEQDAKEESRRSPSIRRLVDEYIEKYAKPRIVCSPFCSESVEQTIGIRFDSKPRLLKFNTLIW